MADGKNLKKSMQRLTPSSQNAQELRQGGYKSFGQAIGQYLQPEGAEPNSMRMLLGNLTQNIRSILGTDDESLQRNRENYDAAVQQVEDIGKYVPEEQRIETDKRAQEWGLNMASNIGAVAPISKAARAENLAKFMEGSKVVDADGNPLVMYHGTQNKIDAFKSGNTFMTDNIETAAGYGGKIYPLIVKSKNPMKINGFGKTATTVDVPDELYEIAKIEYPDRNWDFKSSEEFTIDQLARMIKKYKPEYDGLMVRQVSDPAFHGAKSDNRDNIFVSFSPNQIKSATGNRGTFDPNDPNILHGITGLGLLGNRQNQE
jgi:hypothetical protein